jgi:para-nitrobenzyl esterase
LLAATTAGRSWPGHLIQAEERARIGAPTWMYQLDFPCPEAGGILGAFHTLDIPLVFDNADAEGSRTGAGPDARRLAGRMADAFIALARTGDPNGGGLPHWPHYDLETRPTMIFDRECRVENDPRREERLLFSVAPYVKPGG